MVGRAGLEPATFCASGSARTSGGFPYPPASVDWEAFRKWVKNRYAKSYAPTVYCYARKYHRLLNGNLAVLEEFSRSKRGAILRALVALSKYLGVYEWFRVRMKSYGVKWESQSSFESFMRILREGSDGVVEWVRRCLDTFDDSYATFIEFALVSGLRKTEALNAFNLIAVKGLEGYYNEDLESLEHFRYPKIFIRGSKNVFFSFVPKNLVERISECSKVSESGYKRRIMKLRVPSRLKDLREYYATFMVHHGLIREEVDLIQGRVGKSIFMRHYFSPAIRDLKERTFKGIRMMLRELEG